MKAATRLFAAGWLMVVPVIAATAPLPVTPQHAAMAARYSRAHGRLCLLIEQNGRIIYSEESGLALDEPHRIYSGNKNFVALAILISAQEGLLKLDEPASLTLTEWRHDARRSITIRQLLNQTSGLDPSADLIGDARDQMAASVRSPLIASPGTRFHYGPSNYQALGEILRRKLAPGGESVEDYMKDKVFGPLGIDIAAWYRDGSDHPLMHAGIQLTALEWRKLGDFILLDLAGGKKLLVNPELVAQLFTGTSANPAYGLSFWLNRPQRHVQPMRELLPAMDGEQLDPGGPRDIYAAEGTGKQRLYIIPSRGLVIVRFSDQGHFSDGDFLSRLLTGRPNPDARTH
jgi:CubicO group peptidase (beta-lactamase class C family)